jgi:hypothetical protein
MGLVFLLLLISACAVITSGFIHPRKMVSVRHLRATQLTMSKPSEPHTDVWKKLKIIPLSIALFAQTEIFSPVQYNVVQAADTKSDDKLKSTLKSYEESLAKKNAVKVTDPASPDAAKAASRAPVVKAAPVVAAKPAAPVAATAKPAPAVPVKVSSAPKPVPIAPQVVKLTEEIALDSAIEKKVAGKKRQDELKVRMKTLTSKIGAGNNEMKKQQQPIDKINTRLNEDKYLTNELRKTLNEDKSKLE